MVPMITALVRAISQLSDPAVSRVVWRSIVGAILGFFTLAGLVWILLFQTRLTDYSWLDNTIDVLGGLAVFGWPTCSFPPSSSPSPACCWTGCRCGGTAVLSPGLPHAEGQGIAAGYSVRSVSWS